MIRRPPRSTRVRSSAASDVYYRAEESHKRNRGTRKIPCRGSQSRASYIQGWNRTLPQHSSESLLEHWHYQEGKALQDRWIQLVIDALRDDDIKTAETEMDDKLIFLTFAPIAEKDFVNVYGSDITELKQGEERIKHLNLVLRAIRNINQLIFKEKDREGLIKG